jgi:Amt family ammonium transporter
MNSVDIVNLLPIALTLLFPVGLILFSASAVPEDQAPGTAVNLLVVWSVAALAYFVAGFAFQFGGIAQVSPNPAWHDLYWEWYPLDQSVDVQVARLWGVIAFRGWALSGDAATPGAFLLFLNHLALVGTTALIPVAAIPRRWRGATALALGLLAGLLIYPLPGNWLWGGGWLSNLGASLGLGHGLVDFGGASVIFLTGAMTALAALLMFRSQNTLSTPPGLGAELVIPTGLEERLAVYDQPESVVEEPLPVTPMPSAYLPLVSFLGAGLMLLGWLGLSAGFHNPTATNFSPAQAGVSGLLAALSAALTAASYSWFTTRQLNLLMTTRGLVAGLVLALAGAPFVPPWVLLVAGLLLGLCLPPLIYFFNQGLSLGDEFGLLTTYGISAVMGLLIVPFFADGRAGQGWNGVGPVDFLGVAGQGVSGLLVAPGFAAAWPAQLQAQLVGMGAIALWALLLSALLFQTVLVIARAWARSGLELADPLPTLPAKQAKSREEETIIMEEAEV